ncbi:MAG: glycosyltransferase family 2 protein [Thermodesulfobacteriota bacterium]
MKNKKILITVIIPVYNCEKYLSDAIESVMEQSYLQTEIIVVDDGSTDNSAKIAKSYSDDIKYIYQVNSGPAAARNKGIINSNGEFIAFLDADDLWPSNKLELQISSFMNNENLEIVMGRIQYVELPDAVKRNMRMLDSNNSFKYINLGAGLFKKSVFKKIGYLDREFIYWEDLDWFLRAYEKKTSLIFLDQITMIYRIHSQNMSNNNNEVIHFFYKAIRNSLHRRKNSNGTVNPLLNFLESVN